MQGQTQNNVLAPVRGIFFVNLYLCVFVLWDWGLLVITKGISGILIGYDLPVVVVYTREREREI